MILAHENKCAMCGKETVDNEKSNKKKEQQQQENDLTSSLTIIVEQIDGTYYTFDTATCAMMFKKFNAVYGSNFANEWYKKRVFLSKLFRRLEVILYQIAHFGKTLLSFTNIYGFMAWSQKLNLTANPQLDIKVQDDPNNVSDVKQKVLDFLKVPYAPKDAIQIMNVNYSIICAQPVVSENITAIKPMINIIKVPSKPNPTGLR